MSEQISPEKLDPAAVAKANERLWKNHPELGGRQLTLSPEDRETEYRKEWMKLYHEAEKETPQPPPPKTKPNPVANPPPPIDFDEPPQRMAIMGPDGNLQFVDMPAGCQGCPTGIAAMSHEQKMEEAIRRANLGPEIMEELGDLQKLAAMMMIVGGALMMLAGAGLLAAGTGIGAVIDGIAAAVIFGLSVLAAATSGVQIGGGIMSLLEFYNQTRCDVAKTSDDLDKAGKSFADAIAKMGVGGLTFVLAAFGARGRSWKGTPLKASPPGVVPQEPPAADLAKLSKFAKDSGMRVEDIARMQRYCKENKSMRIMRDFNPESAQYIGEDGYAPKPHQVENLKTAKTGPNAGLVEKPANPSEAQVKEMQKLQEAGWTFDEAGPNQGALRDPEGNLIHGDYDAQGEYKVVGTDENGQPRYEKADTNDPDWLANSNEGITPDSPMAQHGANDNYVRTDPATGEEVMGRPPNPEEGYTVIDENGNVQRVEDTAALKQLFDEKGIEWPYD